MKIALSTVWLNAFNAALMPCSHDLVLSIPFSVCNTKVLYTDIVDVLLKCGLFMDQVCYFRYILHFTQPKTRLQTTLFQFLYRRIYLAFFKKALTKIKKKSFKLYKLKLLCSFSQ